MTRNHDHDEFCCPEFIPACVADDDFCSADRNCPEKIPTAKYPSPTTCLPRKEQIELDERIDAANQFLLDLALSGEQPEAGRRRAFDGLFGQEIAVKLIKEMPEENETEELVVEEVTNQVEVRQTVKKRKRVIKRKRIRNRAAKNKRRLKVRVKRKTAPKLLVKGRVTLVGFNFVILKRSNKEYILPFDRICRIYPNKNHLELSNEPKLLDIDPCLRRAITFHFGETVVSSPKLFKIFFRMRLDMYLLLLVDEKITVVLEEKLISGKVYDVQGEVLTLCMKDKKKKEIPLDTIIYMSS